jgi:hypothetical protein
VLDLYRAVSQGFTYRITDAFRDVLRRGIRFHEKVDVIEVTVIKGLDGLLHQLVQLVEIDEHPGIIQVWGGQTDAHPPIVTVQTLAPTAVVPELVRS